MSVRRVDIIPTLQRPVTRRRIVCVTRATPDLTRRHARRVWQEITKSALVPVPAHCVAPTHIPLQSQQRLRVCVSHALPTPHRFPVLITSRSATVTWVIVSLLTTLHVIYVCPDTMIATWTDTSARSVQRGRIQTTQEVKW